MLLVRAVEQRGGDLCHSSHSFPSDNSQGGEVREVYEARAGRDESSRMHVRVGGGNERGELRREGWSGERSGLKCVKEECREGDLRRTRLRGEGNVRRCCESDGRTKRRDRKR